MFQVDAFTRVKFAGNPAGVVLDADGLREEQMQKIARELNNSETAFVLSPAADDHDVWVRFFTPSCEVPSCGHATIATHYVRALYEGVFRTVRQRCGAGILPVEITKDETNSIRVVMTQAKPSFSEAPSFVQERLSTALGLPVQDFDLRCPLEVVSTGHSKLLIGVKNSKTLNSLRPDSSQLIRLSQEIGVNGYFVFTLDPEEKVYAAEARMFAPAIGIAEDPVTGNGNGPLGAYLVKHGLAGITNGVYRFQSLQGRAIGRPGVVKISVVVEDGVPVEVRVGEEAVIAFSFEMDI